jgi:hypothetical protein
MQPGDAVILDMGTAQTVAKIVLDDAKSPGDYPRGYRLETSADGTTWTQAAQATEQQASYQTQGGVLAIAFTPVTARYLRLTNEGSNGLWWSIHELSVFGP